MNTQHTPESISTTKLVVSEDIYWSNTHNWVGAAFICPENDGRSVFAQTNPYECYKQDKDSAILISDRMVACWNYCYGMPTELLQTSKFDEHRANYEASVRMMAETIEKLTKEIETLKNK